jgi:hypothetical protein
METLKEKIKTLVPIEQVEILREINRSILTDYMIQIDDNFCLYPIEVEAYYYNESNFQDTTVHKNELQKKRFGKLYFHRAGRKRGNAFLFDEGGVDICLSSGEYYFGILIRSTWINEEKEPVCGPGLLTRRIVQHLSNETEIEDETKIVIEDVEKYRSKIEEIENRTTLIKPRKRDISKEYQPVKEYPIIEGKRFGIKDEKHAPYSTYKLRALIGLKKEKHPFKDKERMAISYFEEVKEKEVGVKITMEMIKDVLGFKAQAVYNHFNKE